MAVHFKENGTKVDRGMENGDRSNSRRQSVFCTPYYPLNECCTSGPREMKSVLQRKWLTERLKRMFLFSGLEQRWLEEVVDAITPKTLVPGEYVFTQGQVIDTLYIIGKGVFHEYSDDKYIGSHETGSWGEVGLLHDSLASTSLVAGGKGLVWRLERAPYRHCAATSANHRRRINLRLIAGVPFLARLPENVRTNLADSLIQISVRDGRRIVREGDAAAGLYLVEEGRVSLRLDEQCLETRELHQGEYFGDSSLTSGESEESQSAYAIGNVKLLLLKPEAYERLVGPINAPFLDRKPIQKRSKF